MKHPFQVGGKYRNRDGEYEVIRLDDRKMEIQYTSGRVLETDVELQARIWHNIQTEESLKASVENSGSTSRRRRRKAQRGRGFQGLKDHDFQKGVAGTSWRARTGLGGLLAQRLSDTTPHFFQSYAIYRRAEVHIARPECYDPQDKLRQAKFILSLDSEEASYGFYIEKNEGPMDDTWHWPNFMEAFESNPTLRQEVESAMRKLELHWKLYVWADGGLVTQVKASPTRLMWVQKEKEEWEETQWPVFIKRLQEIEAEKWCDLFLTTSTAKEQVLAVGIQFVDTVAEVYRALLPLYEASTQCTDTEV